MFKPIDIPRHIKKDEAKEKERARVLQILNASSELFAVQLRELYTSRQSNVVAAAEKKVSRFPRINKLWLKLRTTISGDDSLLLEDDKNEQELEDAQNLLEKDRNKYTFTPYLRGFIADATPEGVIKFYPVLSFTNLAHLLKNLTDGHEYDKNRALVEGQRTRHFVVFGPNLQEFSECTIDGGSVNIITTEGQEKSYNIQDNNEYESRGVASGHYYQSFRRSSHLADQSIFWVPLWRISDLNDCEVGVQVQPDSNRIHEINGDDIARLLGI
jgi:hypothetical protein